MDELKIIFMGTPEFAVPSLLKLLDNNYHVVAVITQPDRKRGRGEMVTPCEVKCVALSNDIPVLQPETMKKNNWADILRSYKPNLFVTCAFGQILTREILSIPEYGCINVHASLLPKYRGAAPINHAIINGESLTGITTMMTDIGMDTGDILLKKEVEIDEYMDSGQLHDILKHEGASLLIETVKRLKAGNLKRHPQDNSIATYAPMLKKEDGMINWSNSAKAIHNQIRGLSPWPGCFTCYKGKKMKIIRSGYSNDSGMGKDGEIISIEKDRLVIKCSQGVLYIYEMQFENRNRMTVDKCGHNMEKCNLL